MLIGIISDTHDRLDRTVQAVQLLTDAGATVLIHCGDLTGPAIVEACGRLSSYYVFGNNDYDVAVLRRAIGAVDGVCLGAGGEITLAGKRLAVAHGHVPREVRALLAADPDYFLYGHSHVAGDKREGPTRWINPGALHRAPRFTVALLDPETDDLEYLPVPR
jgi:putative phosphoesterase